MTNNLSKKMYNARILSIPIGISIGPPFTAISRKDILCSTGAEVRGAAAVAAESAGRPAPWVI